MARELTPTESRQIEGKRKNPGSRPRYYDSGTRNFVQVSRDFETLTLLLPVSFRARLGQYLTLLRVANVGPSTMDELRQEFTAARNRDLITTASTYGSLVTAYEEIRSLLTSSSSGFEDVQELQRLLGDLSKTVGVFVDDYEAIKFQQAVANVLEVRAGSTTTSTATPPYQVELQSLVTAMLQYP